MKKNLLVIILLFILVFSIVAEDNDIPYKDFIGKKVYIYFTSSNVTTRDYNTSGYFSGKLLEVHEKYIVVRDINSTLYMYKDNIRGIAVGK